MRWKRVASRCRGLPGPVGPHALAAATQRRRRDLQRAVVAHVRRVGGVDRVAERVVLGRAEAAHDARERPRHRDRVLPPLVEVRGVEGEIERRHSMSSNPAASSSSSIRPGRPNASGPGASAGGCSIRPRSTITRPIAANHGFRVGAGPRGERDPPAGPQDAPRLAQRRLRVGEQHVAPAAQHRVDARRRQVDPLGLHGTDFDVRRSDLLRARLRGLDHRLGVVGDDRLPAGRDELRGQQARCPPRPAASSSTVCPGCRCAASRSHCETAIASRWKASRSRAQPGAAASQRSRLSARYASASMPTVYQRGRTGARITAARARASPTACAAARREPDRLGHLERRQARGAVGAQILLGDVGPHDDGGHHGLAPLAARDAVHGGLGDRRMRLEDGLDLGRRDVLAAGHDRVGLAPDDVQAPSAFHAPRSPVASTGPAPRGDVGPLTRISPSSARRTPVQNSGAPRVVHLRAGLGQPVGRARPGPSAAAARPTSAGATGAPPTSAQRSARRLAQPGVEQALGASSGRARPSSRRPRGARARTATRSVSKRSWTIAVVALIALRSTIDSPPTWDSGSAQSHRSAGSRPSATHDPSALHSQLP